MAALLVLKLTLAPALVGAASLAGRRFGPRVGGWIIGFPVVAGPVLWLYAREQGLPFAARAAAGTTLGVVSLCLFLLVYAWGARRLGWIACLAAGWIAFTLATLALSRLPALTAAPWPVAYAAALAALSVTMALLPSASAAVPVRRARNDLALRMVATAILVVALTGSAEILGPTLSGLFTPFPVATTVLVVFAHREGGADGVVQVYRGFVPSLYSFASFCASLAFALQRLSAAAAFAVALGVTCVAQMVVLRIVARPPGGGQRR